MKLRVNQQVRQRIADLDAAFERFDASVRAIVQAGPDTALDHQIEKSSAEREIIGIAYQLREAARGRK